MLALDTVVIGTAVLGILSVILRGLQGLLGRPLGGGDKMRVDHLIGMVAIGSVLRLETKDCEARAYGLKLPGGLEVKCCEARRTAFQRVHGDSTRCEDVGDREGHPGHRFEGLLWSKCARGQISGDRLSWAVVEELGSARRRSAVVAGVKRCT
ncbi:hypothetical protein FB451DRAFT_1162010 [Mycena latifolia]|nr:hypothetical protein FB451DRAFT_1162010 [Mycena latifolia]